MSYIGIWKFDSLGVFNGDDRRIFLSSKDYLNSPLPLYIDENDEAAVNEEMNERKSLIGTKIKICEDGKLYFLLPQIGDTQEGADLMDGMIVAGVNDWEERDGALWYNTEEEMDNPWMKLADAGDPMLKFEYFYFIKEA